MFFFFFRESAEKTADSSRENKAVNQSNKMFIFSSLVTF